MLHVDTNNSHVHIFMFLVNIIYFVCRGQKYATKEMLPASRFVSDRILNQVSV